MKRRTFAEVEKAARASARNDAIAEVCRVLKHHLNMPLAAMALYDEMQKPTPKRETFDATAPFWQD